MDARLQRLRRRWLTQGSLEAAGEYIHALERLEETTSQYEIRPILVASSTHVPWHFAALLSRMSAVRMSSDPSTLLHTTTEGGWLLGPINNREFEREAAAYQEILPLVRLAQSLGVLMIQLDTDGPVYRDLPTWDW